MELSMGPIRAENDSGVALITLDRSDSGNTLTAESLTALSGALDDAIGDDAVRVVFLRSNGPTFCTGMSLVDVGEARERQEDIETAMSRYCDCLLSIYACPKPVVCCVIGDVKAGGVGLVGACDIVIAAPQATFQLSEIFFGLVPANVLPFIYSLRIAPQTARYLVLTGKTLSAQEALRIQLVNEVFPAETLEGELKAIIRALFRASPKAIARAKQFTGLLQAEKMPQSIEHAKKLFLEMVRDPETAHAINGFNDGSSPPWFARFSPQGTLICKGAL
jgi:enoyl-CoA hydratase/carnithine racemase